MPTNTDNPGNCGQVEEERPKDNRPESSPAILATESSPTKPQPTSKKERILKRLTSQTTDTPKKAESKEKSSCADADKDVDTSTNVKSCETETTCHGDSATKSDNVLKTVENATIFEPKVSEESVVYKENEAVISKGEATAPEQNKNCTDYGNETEVGYPNASTPGFVVDNDESSNDSNSLQIVLPESNKVRRKRKWGKHYDIDKEIENDIQNELEKKAKKTNLTVKNVKTILRYVIGNENVLSMVRNAMKEAGADAGCEFDPALTRSKAKQLREKKKIMWPLSPIKPPPPDEHLVLIREELPEEEDDDEYRPSAADLLDHSDDESGRRSVTSSLNSSTAGHYLETFDPGLLDTTNPPHELPQPEEENPKTSKEFHFKRPMGRRVENIGQRTRSKLSLSSTPLEAIEQAFVPPDITTDMYNFKCDDQDWENFLKEFMQPLPENAADVDEEDDPEYNVLGEEEKVDKEELRRDRGVHVSRAELNTLMMELFQDPEDGSSDEDGSKENDVANIATEAVEVVPAEKEISRSPSPRPPTPELPVIGVTVSQMLLLQQQLRQHVQLVTQHFMQTHKHPLYSKYAGSCKRMLAELVELGKLNSQSAVNVYNLPKAFALIENWEMLLESPKGKEIQEHFKTEYQLAMDKKVKRLKHVGVFRPEFMCVVSNSDVFLYPRLLPPIPFRFGEYSKFEFLPSEDSLIAIGLEQFVPYVKQYPRWCDKKLGPDNSASDLLNKFLLPGKTSKQILKRIRNCRGVKGNPIAHYKDTGKAPPVFHHVIPFNSTFLMPPIKQVKDLLPPVWQEYVSNVKNRIKTKT